jgi:3-hydroxybutyryl-CoA dehydratase
MGAANGKDMHGFYFEDLRTGMAASFGKTITEADILLFAAVSGDTNPAHLNEEFARETRLKTRVAHGALTASLVSAALGTRLPGPGCLFVSQTSNFRAPVKAGDTVTARVTLSRLDPERNFAEFETVCTVGDTVVLDGSALLWIPSKKDET